MTNTYIQIEIPVTGVQLKQDGLFWAQVVHRRWLYYFKAIGLHFDPTTQDRSTIVHLLKSIQLDNYGK